MPAGTYAGVVLCDVGFSFSGQGSDLQSRITITPQAGTGSVMLSLRATWHGIMGLTCNYAMDSPCERAALAACGAGEEGWACSVAGLGKWDDSCFQRVQRPTSAAICYRDGAIRAVGMAPTCRRISGQLQLQQA